MNKKIVIKTQNENFLQLQMIKSFSNPPERTQSPGFVIKFFVLHFYELGKRLSHHLNVELLRKRLSLADKK